MIEFNNLKIIEYEEKNLDDVRKLLTELEEYILSIDEDNLDQLHPDYYEKMALVDLEMINKYDGKCFLALLNNEVIGLIMGCIPPYSEYDYLDYKCPRRGEITELIVTSKIRSQSVGKKLMNHMENYFKSLGCEYVIVDCFSYNKIGHKFYGNNGYHARMETLIKKI